MIDFYSLIKDTKAYKTLKAEKEKGALSHAYLFLTPDKTFLSEYLKEFSKVIMGGDAIVNKKIENDAHPDVKVYPKNHKNVLVEDVKDLIEESFYKPTEGEIKLFVITNAETMNPASQNKLLKTLEEPPKNVVLLLGATSEYALLSTIKSRVKKLEISTLNKDTVIRVLKEEYKTENASLAVSLSDGTLGSAVEYLEKEEIKDLVALVKDMTINMQSSASVLDYSVKITSQKTDVKTFLSVTSWAYSEMLKEGEITGEYPNGYKTGSVINALEKIAEANKRLTFNANATMLVEWLLLQILEGRFKWQKL